MQNKEKYKEGQVGRDESQLVTNDKLVNTLVALVYGTMIAIGIPVAVGWFWLIIKTGLNK